MSERVYFIDENHSYTGCVSGLRYESVSGVAKKVLEPPVDWDAILIRKAKKLGISPEELQSEWNLKREEGTRAGTAVHKVEEDKLFSTPFHFYRGDIYEVKGFEEHGDKKLQTQAIEVGCAYPELILSLEKGHMRIAGQTDLALVDSDGYVSITDTKTDKSIEYEGFRKQGFAEPFGDIQNCNYNMYCLKMGCYMYMVLKANPHLKYGSITLEHRPIERDESGLPVWGEDGLPIVKGMWEIPVDYPEWEPVVKKVLNEYYKLTK